MQADLFFIFGLAAAGFFINFFMPELLENKLEPRDPRVACAVHPASIAILVIASNAILVIAILVTYIIQIAML